MDKWLFYFFDFNRRSPGGKKDPETLRREAICEALDSLVEKEGTQQISTSELPEQNGSGFLAAEKGNSRGGTGSRELRGKGGHCQGQNPIRGVTNEKKRGNVRLEAGRARDAEECLKRDQIGENGSEKGDLKPVSRGGRGVNRRGRGGGGVSRQNLK